MRKLSFEAYVTDDKELVVSSRRYLLIYQAVYNPEVKIEGNDRAMTKRFGKLLDVVDSLAKRENTSVRLNPEGGEFILEDAEFDLLKGAWDLFRKVLPKSLAREITDLDDFIENAVEYRPKE